MHKILIADDEPNIVELLRIEFSESGYEVVTAASGNECLDRIHATDPDLVVLDVRMPDLSGSEVAMRLRSEPKYKNLPIIFLTGLFSKDDEKRMGNEIANQVIFAKPFSVSRLLEKVRELLSGRDRLPPSGRATGNPPDFLK